MNIQKTVQKYKKRLNPQKKVKEFFSFCFVLFSLIRTFEANLEGTFVRQ